jgi:hypothetical protein
MPEVFARTARSALKLVLVVGGLYVATAMSIVGWAGVAAFVTGLTWAARDAVRRGRSRS